MHGQDDFVSLFRSAIYMKDVVQQYYYVSAQKQMSCAVEMYYVAII